MRIGMKVLAILSFLWVVLGSISVWLVYSHTQSLRFAFLYALSFVTVTLVAGTLTLFLQKFFEMYRRQKYLESLREEWIATQKSLKELTSQHSQLEKLVQLL
ncbi:MAG: hypothetical protein NZ805_16235, partial [Armatimonadetes bacterium]|nr:hypothetical protein [Armatimonadota bacterium]